jgi:hypothetical protein
MEAIEHGSIEDMLRAKLSGIRVIPDADAAKADEDCRAKRHYALVNNLRQHWNAPERHAKRDSVDWSGPWGDSLRTIQASLGTGRTTTVSWRRAMAVWAAVTRACKAPQPVKTEPYDR